DVFQAGLVPDSEIDRSASRVLRAKMAMGLFDHPLADPESARYWNGNAAHRQLTLNASRESIVLLRNLNTLPLGRDKKIAVFGVDAQEGRLGGYSSTGNNVVSILKGISEKVGAANVQFVAGPGRSARNDVVIPSAFLSAVDSGGRTVRGLRGEYFDNNLLSGTPRLTRIDPRVDFGWTLN